MSFLNAISDFFRPWRSLEPVRTMRFPIEPVPKGRGRAIVVYPKGGGKPYGKIITPDETREYEDKLRQAAEEYMEDMGPPLTGRIGARVFLQTNNERQDVDNLVKSILDGIAQAKVFVNDNDFDYLEIVRVVDRTSKPYSLVELLQKSW